MVGYFIETVFVLAENQKQSKYLLIGDWLIIIQHTI